MSYVKDIERALVIALIGRIQGVNVDTVDKLCEDAEKVSDTIGRIQGKAMQGLTSRQLNAFNSLNGLQPPLPFGKQRKVVNNEGLLNTEIESLRGQLGQREEQLAKYDERLSKSYEMIQEYREAYEKQMAEAAEKIYQLQNNIYQMLSETKVD